MKPKQPNKWQKLLYKKCNSFTWAVQAIHRAANSTQDYTLRGILYTGLSCLALEGFRACFFCRLRFDDSLYLPLFDHPLVVTPRILLDLLLKFSKYFRFGGALNFVKRAANVWIEWVNFYHFSSLFESNTFTWDIGCASSPFRTYCLSLCFAKWPI